METAGDNDKTNGKADLDKTVEKREINHEDKDIEFSTNKKLAAETDEEKIILDLSNGNKKDKEGNVNQNQEQETRSASSASSLKEVEEQEPAEPMKVDELEEVNLNVIFNKKPYQIKISPSKTVGDLKKVIEGLTGITPGLQKVLVKGINNDEQTLESLNLKNFSKVLVIASTLDQVLEATTKPDEQACTSDSTKSNETSTNWCTLTQHRKIIDKGVPDDVMPGILNEQEALPNFPLSGMLSAKGGKVRLTFKLETDELWISTKERTEKLPMGSIRACLSQPIGGYEHYHILAIQLGPTESSRFFVYWVPAQYIEAIKELLG